MRTYDVAVTCKLSGKKLTKNFPYDEPESLEEGIEMDGEDKVIRTWLNERKTNFQDKMRKEMLKAMEKALLRKIKEAGLSLEDIEI